MVAIAPHRCDGGMLMASISAADYRSACEEVLRAALHRPAMYYSSLAGFEACLDGHATAFLQLGAIGRKESFSAAFSDWLYRVKGASGAASGWAYLIDEMAAASGIDPDTVFRQSVQEFLQQSLWSKDIGVPQNLPLADETRGR